MNKPTVIGGKLKLKSSSKSSSLSVPKSSSKRQFENHDEANIVQSERSDDIHLTEAQRRFKKKKIEKEKRDAEKLAQKSFRDRIDEFNQKLSKLTEHNDIPRVSAAGNG